MTPMAKEDAVGHLLAGDYRIALENLDRTVFPLETAYALFLAGDFDSVLLVLEGQDSIRANWLRELVSLMKSKKMENVTYFQIRNFLELDIDLLIRAQKINYLERLLAYSGKLSEINKECYKFIGRILFNNNLLSLAKYYLDLYKNVVYYDPELHFIYAKYYLQKEDYRQALTSINQCLLVLPEYYPALKLKEEIISYIETISE